MMDTRKALLLILFQAMVNATVFAVEEDSTSPRSVYFLTRENVRLKGHVVKRFASTSLVSCSHSCLTNGWCTSTNFKMLSRMNGKGTCELNKHGTINIHTQTPSSKSTKFHEEQGVTFSMLLKGCLMTGCLNGGSCEPGENKQTFLCSCVLPWIGKQCEEKIAKGWHSHYPAHSCKDIRDSGDSKGDGEYWIDPEKSGNPLKVFCDMTTDGGGWLLVSNYVIDSSYSPPQLSIETKYRGISNYHNNKTFLNKSAMNELRTHLPFTQLRFHCSKQQGRTFHVTTVTNSTGEAVVQYFSGQTDVMPHSCHSFFRMGNDNSELAKVCQEWGTENGIRYNVSKWGCQANEDRLYFQAVIVWYKYHWRITPGNDSRVECDDFRDGVSSGDFWKVYVR